MATGLQGTTDPRSFTIRILDARTTTNSPPSSYAAAGVDIGAILDDRYGAKGWPTECLIHVYTTAGSATMTATVKLWAGFLAAGSAGVYSASGDGSATTAGVLNGGAAFDEHAADVIGRVSILSLPAGARKFYAEVTAIGGTATAVTVDLIFAAVSR